MPLTDFESLEQKFEDLTVSKEFEELISIISRHENIYVIGNGGLHYVASHMATDLSRLLPGKYCHSFDSFGFITSSANDFGFESIFERWLCNCVDMSRPSALIGLSCSGTSKNVVNALNFAKDHGWSTFLITGKDKPSEHNRLCINANYFHTVEAFCLMLFYEIVHRLGGQCPKL